MFISLMRFFGGSVSRVQGWFFPGFSCLETRLVSFEVSDANALHYCSFMLHLHRIIAISKVTYNTFVGVFTLDFLLSET